MPAQDQIIMRDVRIVFRNFSGAPGMYNAEGDRNFAVILDDEIAEKLKADGWNVKYLNPREEGDDPTPYLTVKINFRGPRPPTVHMISSRGTTSLDEETCSILDQVDIVKVDLIVRPYNWEVGGKKGVKAYLQAIYVTIFEDELALEYGNMEVAGVAGPSMMSPDGHPTIRTERARDEKEMEEV
jgi:hypothetical protein